MPCTRRTVGPPWSPCTDGQWRRTRGILRLCIWAVAPRSGSAQFVAQGSNLASWAHVHIGACGTTTALAEQQTWSRWNTYCDFWKGDGLSYHLQGYRVSTFNNKLGNHTHYREAGGRAAKFDLCIVLERGHYNYIGQIHQLFKAKKYCVDCERCVDRLYHPTGCKVVCRLCLRFGAQFPCQTRQVFLRLCNRFIPMLDCFVAARWEQHITAMWRLWIHLSKWRLLWLP